MGCADVGEKWVSGILGKRERKRERKVGTGTPKIRCKGLFPPYFFTNKVIKLHDTTLL